MKLISASLLTLALSSLSALANPVPEANPNVNALQKRATCTITADGARCRRTPSLSADIIGTFGIGRSLSFTCWKRGSSVDGITTWDRTSVNGVPCFVSDTLVSVPCPGTIPECA